MKFAPSTKEEDSPSLVEAEAVRPREERMVLLAGVTIGVTIGFFFLVYIVLAIATGEERSFAPHTLEFRFPIALTQWLLGSLALA